MPPPNARAGKQERRGYIGSFNSSDRTSIDLNACCFAAFCKVCDERGVFAEQPRDKLCRPIAATQPYDLGRRSAQRGNVGKIRVESHDDVAFAMREFPYLVVVCPFETGMFHLLRVRKYAG